MTHREILEKNKAHVIRMWKEGHFLKDIAKHYGVIREAVSNALAEWGVREKEKEWTPNEISLLQRMRRQRKSAKEIASVLGRTESAVRSRLRMIGETGKVYLVNPPLSPHGMSRNADYYALYKGDEYITEGTVRDIAHQLGVEEDTVWIYKTPSHEQRRGKNQRVLVYMGRSGDFYSYD